LPNVNVNGINLYYEECGSGSPLVLLHPWPTDHAMWMFQVQFFSEFLRVITPDSRGLGKSDKPKSPYRLAELSRDVEGLLDFLGIDKAFVVGNSLGANVAQRFTIDHPDRVQASVWAGGARLPMDQMIFPGDQDSSNLEKKEEQESFVDVYLRALKEGGYVHFWETIWKPTMRFQFHPSFSESYIGSYLIRYLFEERYRRLNSDAAGVIGLLEGFRAEASMDSDLSRVSVPACIVAGDGDDSLPYCEAQARLIPNVKLHVVKNSGHFCYMDQPELFNDFLKGFLAANPP
jgi:pimeloyl-ACP methyl ester carboxylesterase